MNLTDLQSQVHDWAKRKDWADPTLLMETRLDGPVKDITRKLCSLAMRHALLSGKTELVRKGVSVSVPDLWFPENFRSRLRKKESRCNLPEIVAKLALIHTEVTEAVEAVLEHDVEDYYSHTDSGANKPEGLRSELADVVIRVMQLAADLEMDLEGAIAEKMAFNETRATKHGKLA
jgi:NTP pyrophosphatase (non-canonical NTP hydrolase)